MAFWAVVPDVIVPEQSVGVVNCCGIADGVPANKKAPLSGATNLLMMFLLVPVVFFNPNATRAPSPASKTIRSCCPGRSACTNGIGVGR